MTDLHSDIVRAYEALQGHDGFILMSSKKNKNFTLARTGSGMDALRAELSDEIMYGIFREAGRELVFTFIPLTVSGVKRARAHVLSVQMANLFRFHQAQIVFEGLANVTLASIRSKLQLDTLLPSFSPTPSQRAFTPSNRSSPSLIADDRPPVPSKSPEKNDARRGSSRRYSPPPTSDELMMGTAVTSASVSRPVSSASPAPPTNVFMRPPPMATFVENFSPGNGAPSTMSSHRSTGVNGMNNGSGRRSETVEQSPSSREYTRTSSLAFSPPSSPLAPARPSTPSPPLPPPVVVEETLTEEEIALQVAVAIQAEELREEEERNLLEAERQEALTKAEAEKMERREKLEADQLERERLLREAVELEVATERLRIEAIEDLERKIREEEAERVKRIKEEEEERVMMVERKAQEVVEMRIRFGELKESGEVILKGFVMAQGGDSIIWKRRCFELTKDSLILFKSLRDSSPMDRLETAHLKRIGGDPSVRHSLRLANSADDDDDAMLVYCDSAEEIAILAMALEVATTAS